MIRRLGDGACAPRRRLRILISAGPTREPIDAVRFISNYSTGAMGACLADEACRRSHQVILVSGPTSVSPRRTVKTIRIERTRQMQEALRAQAPQADVIVMAAAVCDFRPVHRTRMKLPRQGRLTLALRATPDLLASLPRRPEQLVVGFALEGEQALQHAAEKLRRKRLDLIVGQHLPATPGAAQAGISSARPSGNNGASPFGHHRVNAFLLRRGSPQPRRLGRVSKAALARAVLDEIEQLWYGGTACQRVRSKAPAGGIRRGHQPGGRRF